MVTKRELLDSELMRMIFSFRVDTLYNMFALKKEGRMPKIDSEAATGEFDDKGAVIVPGGIVLSDSGGRPIKRETLDKLTAKEFRKRITKAMRRDNAILLYQDGIAPSINLDNGFYARVAADILNNKHASLSRRVTLKEEPPADFNFEEITKSYLPSYIQGPYGSRTILSSCMSVCLTEPRSYYQQCKTVFKLREGEKKYVWDNIRAAKRPIVDKDGIVLAQPYLVICHNTRYKESAYTGITRILGIGKFGEFATFNIEQASESILNELGGDRKDFTDDEIIAEYEGARVVGVLRTYPITTPGKRVLRAVKNKHHGITTMLISPEKDMGLKLDKVKKDAMTRYGLN